jgi:hypothetical protein
MTYEECKSMNCDFLCVKDFNADKTDYEYDCDFVLKDIKEVISCPLIYYESLEGKK